MQIRQYTIPLSPDDFATALKKGLGRALLHAKVHGIAGMEALIIDSLLHNRAYDPQLEGNRSDWLIELVESTDGYDIFRRVVPLLSQPADQYWDATQRCAVAYQLAKRNIPGAHQAIYGCLRRWSDSANVLGSREIIDLDGTDGLLHVARFLGELLQNEDNFWCDDDEIQCFDAHHGKGAGRRILDAAAMNSPSIAAYLSQVDRDAVKKNVRTSTPPQLWGGDIDPTKMDSSEVIHAIQESDPAERPLWMLTWGANASTQDLVAVFEALSIERNHGRLATFFMAFVHGRLPKFDERMLQYVSHPDEEVRHMACLAMSHYQHPAIRRLILKQLESGDVQECGIRLLHHNYRPDDAKLIMKCLQLSDDADSLHGLASDLVDLYSKIKTPECSDVLIFIYEKNPCSDCREKAVCLLAEAGQLPRWIIDESVYDANKSLRDWAIALDKANLDPDAP